MSVSCPLCSCPVDIGDLEVGQEASCDVCNERFEYTGADEEEAAKAKVATEEPTDSKAEKTDTADEKENTDSDVDEVEEALADADKLLAEHDEKSATDAKADEPAAKPPEDEDDVIVLEARIVEDDYEADSQGEDKPKTKDKPKQDDKPEQQAESEEEDEEEDGKKLPAMPRRRPRKSIPSNARIRSIPRRDPVHAPEEESKLPMIAGIAALIMIIILAIMFSLPGDMVPTLHIE
jgi:CRISPR/Cas system-associated protein Cas10 (large subunit of type III CRISPR-Cas system)